MVNFTQYGTGQRVGFALVCIGFCLCFVGSIPPNWMSAKISINDVTGHLDLPNIFSDVNLVELKLGIWWYCVDVISEEKCYQVYSGNDDYKGDSRDGFDWIQLCRIAVVVNGLLGFVCMVAACCRGMCCSGGKTICHGIFAFLSAVSGFAAIGIFASKMESLLPLSLVEVNSGWAFGIYILGSILLTIASLLLCFAAPRQAAVFGTVLSNPAGVHVEVSNTTHSQYNAGPPIQSFEPLPNLAARNATNMSHA